MKKYAYTSNSNIIIDLRMHIGQQISPQIHLKNIATFIHYFYFLLR